MGHSPKGSYAWHDADDSLDEDSPADPRMAGLPEHWRHYERAAGFILLGVLGLVGALLLGLPR